MPPRNAFENLQELGEFASPKEAVEWYRSFGQGEIPKNTEKQLISAVTKIVESDPYGRLGSDEDAQPFLLDAVSMLIDASRITESEKRKDNYRNTARGMLNQISKDEHQPVNVRVSALKYFDDIEFQVLVDAYVSGDVPEGQINEVWDDKCHDSLTKFIKAAEHFDGKDGFQLGSFFEWFWIIGNKYMKTDRRHPELSKTAVFTRAALTREDRAHYGDYRELSGNFDVAYERQTESGVQIVKRVQLKARGFDPLKDKYDSSVEPIYRPSGVGEDNLMVQIINGAKAMRRELASRKKPADIVLDEEEWMAINKAEKLLSVNQ